MPKAPAKMSSLGTIRTFLRVGSCSETLCNVLNRAFDHPQKLEERASMPLAGGLMQHGYQCGMIWGAALAAGAQAYRLHGPGPKTETAAVVAAQRLVESFRDLNTHINCLEITDIDKSSSKLRMVTQFLLKGGVIRCFRMAGRYAPVALSEINAVLAENHMNTPAQPASCAAMMARRMGASDMQAAMTAGFAGGIGLCGGACGALGAVIWIIGMNSSKEQAGKVDYKAPGAVEAVDRFIEHTRGKFECADIVGRRFENVEDHAEYLRDGGCSDIFDVLAAF